MMEEGFEKNEGSEKKERREEIFSKAVRAGKRTYFFDVKATRKNDYYLTITESKKKFNKDGRYYFEKHRAFKNRAMKLMGRIFDRQGLYKNRSILDKVVQPSSDRIQEYLNNSPGQNFINQYMYFYHNILSRYGFNGGFESINRTRKTYYLFYPFALDNILNWKQKFFYNRYLLKKLIARKSKFLTGLRDTNLKKIDGNPNSAELLFKRLELLARSTGIHFPNWVKDADYIDHYQKIMQRPNPIYDKVVDKELILKKKLYKDMNAGGDFLKTKLILDIIVNREFSRLDIDKFMIR